MSDYEDQLYQEIVELWPSSPPPEREYRFHSTRKWRFDLAWPKRKLACEVEGQTWQAGRHTRGSGFEKDAEKYNAAAILGWRVIRVTADMVVDGRALTAVQDLLLAHSHA